jgi:RNA polymerase sigma-70 factor (ECF subfamily)
MAFTSYEGNRAVLGATGFATTHWTVVLNAVDASAPDAQEALEKLCCTYWFPLYAYVRRQGHSSEDAQDLTQEFFARLLAKHHLRRANRERGRFRTFLLTSLQSFLRHEWERARAQKRGGGQLAIPWDADRTETRYRLEVNEQLAPDEVYDQRWAMALFQLALVRLEQESAAKERSIEFEALKRFLSTEPGDGEYEGVASRLGLSTGTIAVAVHRLRHRYGELVREEVAHTVASASEVEDELRYLARLIGC